MIAERIAVIDLGSNTFHLLICELNADGTLAIIYKERVYVKLATGGLGHIKPESAARGIDAMTRFADQIQSYGVKRTRSIGTSALREANNGREIADQFTLATKLPIEIIDGQQEAGYILKGIKTALPLLDKHGLIMDIGGGSVEFILFKGETIAFKGSFKIGVAVLHRLFHHEDPISPEEISALESHLASELGKMMEIIKGIPEYYLIGASGSFEVIQDVLPKIFSSQHWSELDTSGLVNYLNSIIATDISARRQIPEIPIERLDYIVVAYALIRYILKEIPPEKLYFCEFALKEGVLAEMIEKP